MKRSKIIPAMDESLASFSKATHLHGAAWLALMAWCEHVLGTEWVNKNDKDWRAHEFFPVRVLKTAQCRMNLMYHRRASKRREARP